MSDVIRLLPDSVANQIAAGEVIQRPASVIKELVENAVDAGATDIRIILKDAGRTLIQVIDNGSGMSTTDARLAFERHATSKIEQASDLFALHTMGFRGEALASIAAIAQVEMRTMRHGDTIGTKVVINGSKVESQQPEACVPGTNLMVKNLFFNVPARRKFLKKDSVELSNIMHEFERLALVNTGIEFTLIHNDVTLHQLMRGSLKQRIVALFGKSLDRQLIPVETDTSIVRLDGFIGLPENARKRGALQYFFVNGRNMRHPYFHKAVMQCYEQLIPADEQPCYFLNFNVDPETIDVNIHPTKNEIKFENEQPIWQIIVAAVRESLGKFNAGPAIDFDAVDVPDIPVFDPDAAASHDVELDTSYNPFVQPVERPSAIQPGGDSFFLRPMQDWEALYDNFRRESDASIAEVCGSRLNSDDTADELPGISFDGLNVGDDSEQSTAVMQLKGRYILSPAKDGLRIIDQHRAHFKVLYERYLAMLAAGSMTMQRLIFPEVIRLAPSMQPVMEEISTDLCAMGFDVAYLGDTSWSINGVPSVIDSLNPVEIVTGLVETVADTGQKPGEDLYRNVAMTMARGAAVKYGQALSALEMDRLLIDLFSLSAPGYTPDGNPTFAVVTLD
ncbi:MAG: DNA mismatch repair endonuclease MutL, partial [Muribaculaceae bacterium]|nr:DNA mismatch repair endonuclease MutL [Muribaculaceae bacterium]